MAVINLKEKTVECKIVYYGPGRCGKTTNLEYIFKHNRQLMADEMVSIKTKGGIMRQLNYDEDIVDQCNTVGRDGWELVSAIPMSEAHGRTQAVHLIFKRPH